MTSFLILLYTVAGATGVSITEPADGGTYDGDWLSVRAIVENENSLPDSVHYVLNGEPSVLIPRLNTDWYTYMADDLHSGYSESPAPMDDTILWSAQVTGDYHEFPTPIVVDGVVYYPQDSTGDSLYALDAATGEILWSYRTGATDDAVTVKDGLLYTSSDSLWCLNAITGERVWANGDATSAASTPAVDESWVYNCNPSYAGNTTQVYCLNRFTGAVRWNVSVTGFAASCLTVWNGMLFMPTWQGPLYAFDIETGATLWQNTQSAGGYWDSSPVIVDGMLYILGLDSYARAFEPVNGTQVWSTPITPGTYLSATPAFHGDRLYFGDQVDSFHCLDGETGGFIWTVPGVIHGSPGVADGVIFFGEGSNYYDETANVFAYSCLDGSVIWSYQTASGPYGIVSSPSITDGVMYIAGTDWNLYAFGTGLKYTYLDDLYAQTGSNQLIVTSFSQGAAAASDTVNFTVTGTGIEMGPSMITRLTASPNPFSSSAAISFELSEPTHVTVEIFDLAGRSVVTLADGDLTGGVHSLQWNGMTQGGDGAASGLYLCRITAGSMVENTGLCLLR